MELVIDGKWNEVKGQLKQRYGELTENDLMYQEGMEDELFGRIEKKVGKSRAEIEKEISNLLK